MRFEYIHFVRVKYPVALLCRVLDVSRQGYERYKKSLTKPPKYAALLAEIKAIMEEDEFNDSYGRDRLADALGLRGWKISPSTLFRICNKYGILKKKKTPNGLTKSGKDAYKNDDKLQGDFASDQPGKKLVGDITQLPCADGTLYIAGVFDCFDTYCTGLAMDDNMRDELTQSSLNMAVYSHKIKNAIFHSDRGSQYTSDEFRTLIKKASLTQSMSLARLSCYGNAKCESIWGRFKVEAIYGRYNTKLMKMADVKNLVFRYFMGYWNNRRVCSAIGGVTPALKRQRFFDHLALAA